MKCATKPIQHYPLHLRHVATLPRGIKIQIVCKYSADTEESANKLHFKKLPTFVIHLSTSLLCIPRYIQTSYQNLVLVVEYHVDC